MTANEFEPIWDRLCAAYPNVAIRSETMDVYFDSLRVMTAGELDACVAKVVKTARFFPSIAELLEYRDAWHAYRSDNVPSKN